MSISLIPSPDSMSESLIKSATSISEPADIPRLKQNEHESLHRNVGKNCTYNYFFMPVMMSSAQLSAAETVGNPMVLVNSMIA